MGKNLSDYPKNMEEFMAQGWDKKLYYRIAAFSLKDSLNNPEDLIQDILFALIKTDYVARYSEDKGSFITYLYGFTDNLLKKKFNKENTRNGKYIVSAASLITGAPENDAEFNGREVYAGLLDSGQDLEREVLVKTTIEKIRKELAENFTANSSNVYEGKEYQRDPLTVFNLMMEGRSVKEISTILDVSKQFIYHLTSKIKSCPAAKEFFDD